VLFIEEIATVMAPRFWVSIAASITAQLRPELEAIKRTSPFPMLVLAITTLLKPSCAHLTQ